MVKCPGCGGGLFFDPSRQAVVCRQCGSEYNDRQIQTLQDVLTGEESGSQIKKDEYQTMIYTCPNCGGQLISGEETAGTFCSFCGSNVLLEGRLTREKKPESLIPFKITKEQAEDYYRKTIRKNLFTPDYVKKDSHIQEFRGIYMPYWSYSYATDSQEPMKVKSKSVHTKGSYEITDYYETTSMVEASQSGMSFDAVSSFSDSLSEGIAPFNEKECKEFHPAYLSGFYADLPDVKASNYAEQAADETRTYIAKSAIKDPAYKIAGAEVEDIEKAVHVKKTSSELKMYPVWFLASRSKNNRVSYAVVNGQSGKVAADLPVSFLKYFIGSCLLAIPLFFLLNLGISMTAHTITFIAVIASVIGLILLNRDINWAYTMEQNLDDIGYLAVHDEEVTEEDKKWLKKLRENRKKEAARDSKISKSSSLFQMIMRFSTGYGWGIFFIGVLIYAFLDISFELFMAGTAAAYLVCLLIYLVVDKGIFGGNKQIRSIKPAPWEQKKSLYKPMIGMAVCILCLFINPVRDQYYYGAAIFAILMTIWSVYDLIKQHNRQTTRPLPQFNQRGGAQILSFFLISLLITGSLSGNVRAAQTSDEISSSYCLMIDDQEDLLTEEQEKELTVIMSPILKYGHAAFVTVYQNQMETSSYASSYYKSNFGSESGVLFIIDMGQRMIYIFSDGLVYRSVTNSKADTITDNVYNLATDRAYFECADKAFSQILQVLEGQAIAEPMKMICNLLLALLSAFLLNYLFVSFSTRLEAPTDEERELNYLRSFKASSAQRRIVRTHRRYVSSSSGGGGGSSGGGGGSSGGGGGHSF